MCAFSFWSTKAVETNMGQPLSFPSAPILGCLENLTERAWVLEGVLQTCGMFDSSLWHPCWGSSCQCVQPPPLKGNFLPPRVSLPSLGSSHSSLCWPTNQPSSNLHFLAVIMPPWDFTLLAVSFVFVLLLIPVGLAPWTVPPSGSPHPFPMAS